MDSLIGAVFIIAVLGVPLGIFVNGTCYKMRNLP